MTNLWFACSEPERPADPYIMFHYGTDAETCSGCALKAEVSLRQSELYAGEDTWLKRAIRGDVDAIEHLHLRPLGDLL